MVLQSKGRVRDQDRISELPDGVLSHILGFLGPEFVKCAARTSILSKRWKNMWECAPNVTLNSKDFRSIADFRAVVDRLLRFRGSSTIQKLYLHFNCCSAEDISRVDAWIRTAIRCNVVELDLYVHCDGYEMFELPESLFTCKTLTALKLRSKFVINMPTSACFPSLKLLYFTVLTAKDSMDFSHCPALEHLAIDRYPVDAGFYFNISLSGLKTLKMTSYDICSVHINAPKLEKLDLKGSLLSDYVLENTKSLVEANIYLYHEEEEGDDEEEAYVWEEGYEEEEGIEEDAAVCTTNLWNNLLEGISGVKYLSLSSHISEDCFVPAFDKLIKLTLAVDNGFRHSCCYRWDILTVLLERSSNLECLVLKHESDVELSQLDYFEFDRYIDAANYEVATWCQPESVPKCVMSNLKSVFLIGFERNLGHPDQMEVLEYLLKYGQVLKEMTMYSRFQEPEFYSELSRFEWDSETCQLKIISMSLF